VRQTMPVYSLTGTVSILATHFHRLCRRRDRPGSPTGEAGADERGKPSHPEA
jgi:hypothetical protein